MTKRDTTLYSPEDRYQKKKKNYMDNISENYLNAYLSFNHVGTCAT